MTRQEAKKNGNFSVLYEYKEINIAQLLCMMNGPNEIANYALINQNKKINKRLNNNNKNERRKIESKYKQGKL